MFISLRNCIDKVINCQKVLLSIRLLYLNNLQWRGEYGKKQSEEKVVSSVYLEDCINKAIYASCLCQFVVG